MGNINRKNEINCIYIKKARTIDLFSDYDGNIYKRNVNMYVNNKEMKCNNKFTSNEVGKIQVKFIFHNLLVDTSYMFNKCSSLESIDLSLFNTTNVTNMSIMFYHCSSLESIDLSSFNTTNVKDMSYMTYNSYI